MAKNTTSAQYDMMASYVDGLHVKIAEAYKPPRKIALPVAYNNKLPDTSKYTYDFGLETSVVEKMAEWRKARNVAAEARRARLREKQKKKDEEMPPPVLTETTQQSTVKVALNPETKILTPQPLSRPINDLQFLAKSNGLDYSDFDNDTSSPFDNMELKTINDMEELAQVLQPTSQWAKPPDPESASSDKTNEPEEENTNNEDRADVDVDNNVENHRSIHSNHRSVSAILQELQKELARPAMENWKPYPDLESPEPSLDTISKGNNSSLSNHSNASNMLVDLAEEDQKLAKHLSDMGFPLERTARVIRKMGGEDDKRLVEYLLTVQSLEEYGVLGDDAEKILALTEYDLEKAKLYYQNLRTLRDLGFPEDQASLALLRCNMDRDQALDFLIA